MSGDLDVPTLLTTLNWQLVALLIAAFLAGIIRGFAGFGSALLLVPVLALMFDPREAVAMEVIVEIPVTLGLLPAAFRGAERKTVLPILVMLILTLPVGAALLKFVDADSMKVVISIVVLGMVALIARQGKLTALLNRPALYITGAVIGALQGATGMAGPAAATTLMARGDHADVARSNLIAVAAALIFFSAATFWMFGLMTQRVVTIGLLACPACLLGVFAGTRLFARYGNETLRPFVLALVTGTALITLASVFLGSM